LNTSKRASRPLFFALLFASRTAGGAKSTPTTERPDRANDRLSRPLPQPRSTSVVVVSSRSATQAANVEGSSGTRFDSGPQ
jgi:hypothetical protein